MSRATRLYDGDQFTHRGLTFRVSIVADYFHSPPWEEYDGHGVVSDWTTRKKAPGERVLNTDRGSYRYYDVAASMVIALRDAWDAEPYHAAFPTETKREQAARAVEKDFQFLRGWCHDDWSYIGVEVTRLDTGQQQALWGIESNAYDYHGVVARELAEELIDDAGDRAKLEATRVVAPWADAL
jgi:hypothetical protein